MVQQTGYSNRKIRRSYWLMAGAIVLGCLVLPTVAQQSSAPVNNQGRQLSLEDQLKAGLKAFTKADKKFIDEVVLKVEEGKLPERLVNATFLWARDRAARKSRARELRPMVYFRPAITIQAKRIGVLLSVPKNIVIARPGRPRTQ